MRRSAARAMVGHKTESIYRRYAIVDAGALREAAEKIDRATGDTFKDQMAISTVSRFGGER